jgi:hypothetical protein
MRNRHPLFLLLGIVLLVGPILASTPLRATPASPADDAAARARTSVDNTSPQGAADARVPVAVVKELEYDAGTVKQGITVSHVFKVKNTGKADLHILKAKPG